MYNTLSSFRLAVAVALLALPFALIATTVAAQSPPAAAAISSRTAPQDGQPDARTLLDGYVAQALRANLAIARQTEAARRADAAVREASGRFLPTVGVNARYSEFSGVVNIGEFINPVSAALNQLTGTSQFPTNVGVTLPFTQETKLEFTQPLFNDALFGARAAARAQRDLVGDTRAVAIRQLAADVQQTWLGYASAARAVETLEATIPLLDENVRVSERLIAAGQATPDVLLRARAERSELDQQLQDAARQRDALRRGFNLLRNEPDDAPIGLASDSTLLDPDTLSGDALLAHALAHREELAQARSGIRFAGAQQRLAGASFLPSLALAASYGVQGDRYRFDSSNDVAIASLVFSWNLFNGGQDASRREQASALRSEAEFQRREAERAIRLQVGNALDGVQWGRSVMRSAADRFASAERAFALVQRRYGEGLATAVEFLSARTAYTAASINRVITRFTFAARVVELERAAALRPLPR